MSHFQPCKTPNFGRGYNIHITGTSLTSLYSSDTLLMIIIYAELNQKHVLFPLTMSEELQGPSYHCRVCLDSWKWEKNDNWEVRVGNVEVVVGNWDLRK